SALRVGARRRVELQFVLAVELDAYLDTVAALFATMPIGIAQRIDTATVLLLVEGFTLADFDHACRPATFAPVVGPVDQFGVARSGALARTVDLVHVLPARNTQ